MNLLQQLRKDLGEDRVMYREFYKGIDHPVYCRFCCEVVSGPAYVLDHPRYNQSFHKSCAEVPRQIEHPLHPHHPLMAKGKITDGVYDGFICDGCRHYSWGFRYRCHKCDLNFDVQCVSKHESQQLALKERIEIETPFHRHKLQLFYYDMLSSTPSFEDIICCYCLKGFQGSAYACLKGEYDGLLKCDLFIHESCIDKIPQQVDSPFHQQHPLLLRKPSGLKISYLNRCGLCFKRVHGLALSCEECDCNFHISCCTHTTSALTLKQHHEEHPMLYVYMPDSIISRTRKCIVCNTTFEDCATYSCLDCEEHVHMECIPLPRVVKHESHPFHALTLSDSTYVPKIASNEYRCVICEEEGDPKHHFYYCEECSDPDIAHIDCVIWKEPPLEILEYLVPRSPTKKSESEEKKSESEEYMKKLGHYLVPPKIRKKFERQKYFVPGSREQSESEKETYGYESEQDDKAKQQNNIDNKCDKSAQGKDKVQEPEEQKEGKSELEEIDKNIADVEKKMDKLAKELEVLATELEVLQKIRAQKLNPQPLE